MNIRKKVGESVNFNNSTHKIDSLRHVNDSQTCKPTTFGCLCFVPMSK